MPANQDSQSHIYHRNPASQRGWTAVPNDLIDDHSLTAHARFLYIVLKRYAWKHGSAWPGQVRLAADLLVSDRTIRTYLDELKAAGLLTVEQRGNMQTNVYWLEEPGEPPQGAPEDFSAPQKSDRKPTSGHDRKPASTHDRKPTSGHTLEEEDSFKEDKGEEGSSLSTERKKCAYPGCTLFPPDRPLTARYCTEHGNPRSGYMLLLVK